MTGRSAFVFIGLESSFSEKVPKRRITGMTPSLVINSERMQRGDWYNVAFKLGGVKRQNGVRRIA